jgi:ribosome biogenesis SPOUT family RNA methylase Rps3
MIYIIEHLDDEVYEWSLLEYKHISKTVGKENLWFTNVKKADFGKLQDLGKVFSESVVSMGLTRICLLDPSVPDRLKPSDKKEFDYVVFGGILGDNPPRGRTKALRTIPDVQLRNLGEEQMSTNTAVYVVKKIMDGTQFERIDFVDTLILPMDEGEEVELPYRYVFENGEPILPEGLVDKLKNDEDF